MGFFSWMLNGKSIANQFSNRETFPVVMLDNKGNAYVERNYEGYGVFGGKDFYELMAEMNGLPSDRDEGIELMFKNNPRGSGAVAAKHGVLMPAFVTLAEYEKGKDDPAQLWVDAEIPEPCPDQGFFLDDEEDEDDWY